MSYINFSLSSFVIIYIICLLLVLFKFYLLLLLLLLISLSLALSTFKTDSLNDLVIMFILSIIELNNNKLWFKLDYICDFNFFILLLFVKNL